MSWASADTRFCNASGDWGGKFGTEGAWWSPPLDGPKTFTLKCASRGGGVSSTVNVAMAAPEPEFEPVPLPEPDPPVETVQEPEPIPEPATPPTITLVAADREVLVGSDTAITWTTAHTDRCE
ncbi:MAG: hypothetical protein O7G86_07425, partial [Gammaproteobacteria bacterium]|nr:hypothetical protein [Gammaproteobacteria bacterium]